MATHAEWANAGTLAAPETGTPAAVPAAPAAPETAAPSTTPSTTPSDTPAAGGGTTSATDAQLEALEALLDEKGEQKLSIPLTARIPWKQNGKEGFSTLKEIREAHLFHRDYTPKMQALKEQKAAIERQTREIELNKAAQAEERRMWEEEMAKARAAEADPEEYQKYLQHAERLRSDPEYKKLYDDALAHRQHEVRSARDAELTRYEEASSVAQDASDYITRVAGQYPGVDPERIRTRFAAGLRDGSLQLHARTVDQLFAQEADYLGKSVEPLRGELEGLKAKLAALEAADHNKTVVAGVRASTTPEGAATPAARSAAPAGGKLPPPRAGETMSERALAWGRTRR